VILMLASSLASAGPDRWRFEDLYPTEAAFDAARKETEVAIQGLGDCQGKLGTDAATLYGCLQRQSDVAQAIGRLASYSSNHVSADTRDTAWAEKDGAVQVLQASFAQATSWVQPELVALGSERLEAWLAAEPRLQPWQYPLRSILRRAAHVLPPGEEQILALAAPVAQAPSTTYTVFTSAELPWPTVKLPDGTETRLAQQDYTRLRTHPDPATRKLVFDSFFGAYQAYEGTLGGLLASQVQVHWMNARARGYGSCVEASLDNSFVPRAVYDTLVAQTNAHLPTLHRYFRLRRELLGIEKLTYADLYVPVVRSDRKFPLDESIALALASAAPLGKDYVAAMKKGFEGGWIDAYPRPGKVGGAYMSDSAYGVHPYVLLNHNDDLEGAVTLAHEYGHAMHSHYAMGAQPFATAGYTPFVAEVASTFNEALLAEHLRKAAKTDEERLFLLGSELESLRLTYFRQAMFGEYELAIHEVVERGEPLTGAVLTRMYADLLRKYHGPDVLVDDVWTREWAYVPHFYYDFYVFQYATSLAGSSLLAERVLKKQKGSVDEFLGLLKAGGSADPYVLLKDAGVDLATPAPYDALAARMEHVMDEIERLRKK
jgi:oligoendopeptidase F